MKRVTLALVSVAVMACGAAAVSGSKSNSSSGEIKVEAKKQDEPKFTTVKVLNKYPHRADAYTQGLLIEDGVMYESTGEYGHSSLRKTDITTGEVKKQVNLDKQFFGEGLALSGDKFYQLTWMEEKCFVYDKASFKKLATMNYTGQGWGLVEYEGKLLMTNGSAEVKVLDPRTLRVEKSFEVRDNRGKVSSLNELEMVGGLLYANIYTSPIIAVINPKDGKVVKYIDCSPLYKEIGNQDSADVLNGIAYDSVAKKLYVTGKLWDTMFEIEK